jgi:hypothetical protein
MSTEERFHGVWVVCNPKKQRDAPANLNRSGVSFKSFTDLVEYLWYEIIAPPDKWSTGGKVVYFFPHPRRDVESVDEWTVDSDEWARMGFVPLIWGIDTEKQKAEALEFCANHTGEFLYGGTRLSMLDMVSRLWADRPAVGVVVDNTYRRRPRRRKTRMALREIV